MKFVSIICPVYNCERYIEKCIQSVLKQAYKNWELIIIDDGSKDASGQIGDKYANQSQNIKPRLFTAIPCEVAEIHVITVF